MNESSKEANELNAETTWFHVFRSMVMNGEVAKMGPIAYTIYCVIKAHTNFNTGHSFPSIETIVEKSGASRATVMRELVNLEKFGYVTKEKRGRHNLYQLRERVEIMDEHGRPQAVATWDYLPAGVQAAVADLKNVLVSGDLTGAKVVNIERLTVNVHTGSGPLINLDVSAMKDSALKTQLESLLRNVAKNRE